MKGSMARSLRVQQVFLNKVKLALRLNGFPSQRALAEEVGFSLATVSNFLNGKPVDYATFEELCLRLGLDWRDVAALDVEVSAEPADQCTAASESPHTKTFPPIYPNGAVPLGSPFYIERVPFEAQVNQEISKPGALVRIKAPREMGKTSILMRVLDSANQLGYYTINLNLAQVDQATLDDLDQFLRWLCANMARQLQLKPRLDEYWDEDLGKKISCTAYIEDYLLASIDAPLVLALDEVSCIFEHPKVAKDFLPLLRSWYEEAKTLPIWQKLRLIVAHSTEIYVPLDLNHSPFNVGLPIQLSPFSYQEVQLLAQRYGLDWSGGEEVRQLMDMVGGHPALVHIAIYHLSRQEITLEKLLKTAPTANGIYKHHLQRHWVILQEQPELHRALSDLIGATEPIQLDRIIVYKLSSLGLIERLGDKVFLSYQLYRHYFEDKYC